MKSIVITPFSASYEKSKVLSGKTRLPCPLPSNESGVTTVKPSPPLGSIVIYRSYQKFSFFFLAITNAPITAPARAKQSTAIPI